MITVGIICAIALSVIGLWQFREAVLDDDTYSAIAWGVIFGSGFVFVVVLTS